MKVLVTGANGFIGREVCRYLLSNGIAVRGTVREEREISTLPSKVEATLLNDFQSSSSWKDKLNDVSAVIHLVAKTHSHDLTGPESYGSYRSVNVGITKALLDACAGQDIKRFIYMSSIKTVGESSQAPLSEENPCCPEDNYGKTKKEAEDLVISQCRAHSMEYIIIRPPMVYGPGVKGNFLKLLRISDKKIPLPFASVENRRSIVYIRNLADALIYLLKHENSGNNIFHVSDDPPVSIGQLIYKIREELGHSPMMFHIPVKLMTTSAAILGKEDEARKILGSLTVSSHKIRNSFSWKQPFSLMEGIRDTCDWFRMTYR